MEFVNNMFERGSSVLIVTRLKAGRLKKFLVRIPAKEIDFSLLQIVQTDPWAHPASDSVDTKGYEAGSKAAGA